MGVDTMLPVGSSSDAGAGPSHLQPVVGVPVGAADEERPLTAVVDDMRDSESDAGSDAGEEVPLSFADWTPQGPISAEAQVFHLRNVLGRKVEIRDAEGNIFLKGQGKIKALGYRFDFEDANGVAVFTVGSKQFQLKDLYEWILPNGEVIATGTKGRCQKRTSIYLRPGTETKGRFLAKCKCSKVIGGDYSVTTGTSAVGSLSRKHSKGVVTHQNYTIQVPAGTDPYLMIMLALMCNCVNNERAKILWGIVAAGVIML